MPTESKITYKDVTEEAGYRHDVAGKECVHARHECFLAEKDIVRQILDDLGDKNQTALYGRIILR